MTFTRGFVILALVSCALAMPVPPVEETPTLTDRKSTPGSNVAVADSKTPKKPETPTIGNHRNADDQHQAVSDKTTRKAQQQLESVAHKIAERSTAEASQSDDLETAAGTNLLRPLFVYRQQVAYRQRIKDARRRGLNSSLF